MRVAFVSDFPNEGQPPIGGVEGSVSRLAAGLAARGVDVTVVTPGATAEWSPSRRVNVISVDAEERWGLIHNFRRWRSGVASVLADVRPDVVHGQGLPVPGAACLGAANGAPCLITAHGSAKHDTTIGSTRRGARARTALLRLRSSAAIRAADAVVGVHPNWRLNLPVPTAAFVHIPNIVDAAYFEGRRSPVRGRVLFAGGARKIKGWDIIAAAWPLVEAAVPEANLAVVGWSPDDPPTKLEGAVTVKGQLSPEEMLVELEGAEVVVIPSRYEVAPVALAEAWALGVPVVATRVGGIPELADGAAVLVASEDPRALATGLISVLTGTSPIDRLTNEGRKRAQSYGAPSVVDAHLRLYEKLLTRA
jgi:glycosyltransferase involved in cell wall biosynthesis